MYLVADLEMLAWTLPSKQAHCKHAVFSELAHYSSQLDTESGPKLASFPGPAQLSGTCSMEKWGEPGIFFHVRMT